MNFYPFHIGDYTIRTRHLSLMEDLAYRRLLDLYYISEGALPADVERCAKLIGMRDQVQEVRDVLAEFFVLGDEGYSNKRADEELGKFKDKVSKAKASARASVEARSTNAQRTLNERSTKVQPPEPIPEPEPRPKREESGIALVAQLPPAFLGDSNSEGIPLKARVVIAAAWELPSEWGLDAEALGWKPPEILRESEKFRQYWVSGKGMGTRRTLKGWRQSWSNWLSKAERYAA